MDVFFFQRSNFVMYSKIAHLVAFDASEKVNNAMLISPDSLEFIFTPLFPEPILLAGIFAYLLNTNVLYINFFRKTLPYDTTRLKQPDEPLLLTLIIITFERDMVRGRLIIKDNTNRIIDMIILKNESEKRCNPAS